MSKAIVTSANHHFVENLAGYIIEINAQIAELEQAKWTVLDQISTSMDRAKKTGLW